MASPPRKVSPTSSAGFVPVPKTKSKQHVSKTTSLLPSKVPISSIKFSPPKDLLGKIQQELIPLAMQMKALSIFTVKSLIIEGVVSNVQGGLTGIGSLFVGVNLPASVINTYSLVKNWSKMDWKQRLFLGSTTLANYALSGAGISLLLAKAPAFSGFLSKAGAVTAGKVAFILGPIGMGVISIVSTAKGVLAAKKARELSIKEDAAGRLSSAAKAGIGKDILTREESRFSALKKFAIADSAKYLLVGIGIGIGAAFMAGYLAQPWGWVAISLVGAGTVIGIGTLVVRLRGSADREKKDAEEMAPKLVDLLRTEFDFSAEFKNKTEKEIAEQIQDKLAVKMQEEIKTALTGVKDEAKAEFKSGGHVKMILNSQTWPKNPTLLELVAKSIHKEINP